MRKNLTLIIFMLLINLLSVFMIQNGSAKQIVSYDDSNQNNSFTHDLDLPNSNGSYANRIAFENYEYELGTNLSSRYSSSFNCIVTQFNDIDFSQTNRTYISKGLLATKIGASNYLARLFTFTNTIDFSSVRNRIIIEKKNCQSVQFRFYYSATKYLNIYLNFNTRALQFQNESGTVFTTSSFLPVSTSYTNLYFAFERLYILQDFYMEFRFICYNKTNARIISQNSVSYNLNYTQNFKILSSTTYYQFASLSDSLLIIAEDNNYLTNKFSSTQKAIINFDYLAYDIRTFYQILVPLYEKEFSNKGLSQKWVYATTLYKGRYLNYKTNASIYTSTTTALIENNFENTLRNSFSMKYELGLNNSVLTDESFLTFTMNNSYISLDVVWIYDRFYFFLKYWELSNPMPYTIFSITSKSVLNNRIIYQSQFKNKFLYSTIQINNTIYNLKTYVNDVYCNSSIRNFYILNYDLKSLSNLPITIFSNSTIDIKSDIFTFNDRVKEIRFYHEFTDSIVISDYSLHRVHDSDNIYYDLLSSNVFAMNFVFERNSANGEFTISRDNSYQISIFDNSDLIDSSISYNFLSNTNEGLLYLKSRFWTSSESQITINISISITRILIYSDHIPQNNLLISKALEFILPLSIFGLIVIAFKSNSNNKYFGFIGIYLALIVFYLLEYMSLIFLILCIVLTTIGLYFIIKHEKGEI